VNHGVDGACLVIALKRCFGLCVVGGDPVSGPNRDDCGSAVSVNDSRDGGIGAKDVWPRAFCCARFGSPRPAAGRAVGSFGGIVHRYFPNSAFVANRADEKVIRLDP
jgi:hypothetical protein